MYLPLERCLSPEVYGNQNAISFLKKPGVSDVISIAFPNSSEKQIHRYQKTNFPKLEIDVLTGQLEMKYGGYALEAWYQCQGSEPWRLNDFGIVLGADMSLETKKTVQEIVKAVDYGEPKMIKTVLNLIEGYQPVLIIGRDELELTLGPDYPPFYRFNRELLMEDEDRVYPDFVYPENIEYAMAPNFFPDGDGHEISITPIIGLKINRNELETLEAILPLVEKMIGTQQDNPLREVLNPYLRLLLERV